MHPLEGGLLLSSLRMNFSPLPKRWRTDLSLSSSELAHRRETPLPIFEEGPISGNEEVW